MRYRQILTIYRIRGTRVSQPKKPAGLVPSCAFQGQGSNVSTKLCIEQVVLIVIVVFDNANELIYQPTMLFFPYQSRSLVAIDEIITIYRQFLHDRFISSEQLLVCSPYSLCCLYQSIYYNFLLKAYNFFVFSTRRCNKNQSSSTERTSPLAIGSSLI